MTPAMREAIVQDLKRCRNILDELTELIEGDVGDDEPTAVYGESEGVEEMLEKNGWVNTELLSEG